MPSSGKVSGTHSSNVQPPLDSLDSESEAKPSTFKGRVKNALGLGPSSRTKGAPSAHSPASPALTERKLASGQAPAARAKSAPLPADFAPQTQKLTQFLTQKALNASWSDAHSWHPELGQHLLSALRESHLHATLGSDDVNDPAKLLKYLIDQAVDAAPEKHRGTLRLHLTIFGETDEFKNAHASALKNLGDARAQILAQHADAKFEKPVLKNDLTLDDLPREITESKEFKAFAKEFAKHLVTSGGKLTDGQIKHLGGKFNAVLNLERVVSKDKSVPLLSDMAKFALTLSDGKAFMHSLSLAVKEQAPFGRGGTVGGHLAKLETSGALTQLFDQAVIGLDDRQESDGVLILGGQRYVQKQPLGNGAFGTVYLYKKDPPVPLDPGVVVKVPLTGKLIQDPANEGRLMVNALGTGATENIVPLRNAVRTPDGKLLLVLPLAKHGSLENAYKNLAPNQFPTPQTFANALLTPMLDLAQGIERLQLAKGQLHFDIGARNVLITEKGVGQLADFGLAEQLAAEKPGEGKSQIVTDQMPWRWTAPERILGQPVTDKSDVWMFGMTLYEVAVGKLPFKDMRNDQVVALLTDPNFSARNLPTLDANRWPPPLDKKLRDLLIDILQKNPADRPSMDEVRRRLETDFPGIGSAAARDWLHLSLSDPMLPTLKTLSDGVAATVGKDSGTWAADLKGLLTQAFKDPALSNRPMRELLSDPEKSLDQLIKGAVESAPPAQKETLRAALRDPKFIAAFNLATADAVKAAPMLPPPPLIVPTLNRTAPTGAMQPSDDNIAIYSNIQVDQPSDGGSSAETANQYFISVDVPPDSGGQNSAPVANNPPPANPYGRGTQRSPENPPPGNLYGKPIPGPQPAQPQPANLYGKPKELQSVQPDATPQTAKSNGKGVTK